MNYSTVKPSSSVQFKLDTYTEELVEKYFLLPDKDISQFVEPIYEEEEKRWISLRLLVSVIPCGLDLRPE